MESNETSELPKVVLQDLSIDEPNDSASTVLTADPFMSALSLRPRLRRLSTSKSTDSIYSEGTTEIRQLDRALEKELKDEELPVSDDATTVKTGADNPYHSWECGFGFTGTPDDPDEIPTTTAEFIQAVKGEITTISFIQNGLSSYSEAINSGMHHAFSKDFLKHQTDATHRTIGQLFQISRHLQNVVREVEVVKDDSTEVKAELREAFGHAQPWIQRTRAILVSSHVFYKINYVLGSDKNKHH